MMFGLTSLFWGGVRVFKESFLARVITISLAALIALKSYGLYQQGVGKASVIQDSLEAGSAINKKNSTKREKASKPGAHKRLLKKYCRDCDG